MKAQRLLATLLLAVALPASALPESLRQTRGDWQQWGSGEMRWYGFALYRATLWVAGRSSGELPAETPHALALEYRRDIPGARIVEASVDQMRRLGAGASELRHWETEMRRVFPDVVKGDTLTGLHQPGHGARFFLGERELGEIADPEFARRFFAIWLDPRTSAPAVRAALLRLPPD